MIETRNLVPLPYRRVSVQPYAGELGAEAVTAHLLGREAYRRTDFVVLRAPSGEHAVAAVTRASNEPLFSPITAVEVLAELAHRLGVGADRTLIVEGLYDHVNFIHRPDPIVLRVVEVAPPEPPKLYDLVKHVLGYAELPPIRVELERIELAD